MPVILVRFLMKLQFLRKNFEKFSNIKFHETLSSASRVVPYRKTEGQTHMMEIIVVLRNFANVPKNDGEIVHGKINVID